MDRAADDEPDPVNGRTDDNVLASNGELSRVPASGPNRAKVEQVLSVLFDDRPADPSSTSTNSRCHGGATPR